MTDLNASIPLPPRSEEEPPDMWDRYLRGLTGRYCKRCGRELVRISMPIGSFSTITGKQDTQLWFRCPAWSRWRPFRRLHALYCVGLNREP